VGQGRAAFDRAARRQGRLLAGAALAGPELATTLRPGPAPRDLTAGAATAATADMVGMYLLEVDDLDVATSLCELLPSSLTIELRPVVDPSQPWAG
jgi:hypothetical protein